MKLLNIALMLLAIMAPSLGMILFPIHSLTVLVPADFVKAFVINRCSVADDGCGNLDKKAVEDAAPVPDLCVGSRDVHGDGCTGML
jgi:hypothetical protein